MLRGNAIFHEKGEVPESLSALSMGLFAIESNFTRCLKEFKQFLSETAKIANKVQKRFILGWKIKIPQFNSSIGVVLFAISTKWSQNEGSVLKLPCLWLRTL